MNILPFSHADKYLIKPSDVPDEVIDGLIQKVEEEATCPFLIDLLVEPVIYEPCGHSLSQEPAEKIHECAMGVMDNIVPPKPGTCLICKQIPFRLIKDKVIMSFVNPILAALKDLKARKLQKDNSVVDITDLIKFSTQHQNGYLLSCGHGSSLKLIGLAKQHHLADVKVKVPFEKKEFTCIRCGSEPDFAFPHRALRVIAIQIASLTPFTNLPEKKEAPIPEEKLPFEPKIPPLPPLQSANSEGERSIEERCLDKLSKMPPRAIGVTKEILDDLFTGLEKLPPNSVVWKNVVDQFEVILGNGTFENALYFLLKIKRHSPVSILNRFENFMVHLGIDHIGNSRINKVRCIINLLRAVDIPPTVLYYLLVIELLRNPRDSHDFNLATELAAQFTLLQRQNLHHFIQDQIKCESRTKKPNVDWIRNIVRILPPGEGQSLIIGLITNPAQSAFDLINLIKIEPLISDIFEFFPQQIEVYNEWFRRCLENIPLGLGLNKTSFKLLQRLQSTLVAILPKDEKAFVVWKWAAFLITSEDRNLKQQGVEYLTRALADTPGVENCPNTALQVGEILLESLDEKYCHLASTIVDYYPAIFPQLIPTLRKATHQVGQRKGNTSCFFDFWLNRLRHDHMKFLPVGSDVETVVNLFRDVKIYGNSKFYLELLGSLEPIIKILSNDKKQATPLYAQWIEGCQSPLSLLHNPGDHIERLKIVCDSYLRNCEPCESTELLPLWVNILSFSSNRDHHCEAWTLLSHYLGGNPPASKPLIELVRNLFNRARFFNIKHDLDSYLCIFSYMNSCIPTVPTAECMNLLMQFGLFVNTETLLNEESVRFLNFLISYLKKKQSLVFPVYNNNYETMISNHLLPFALSVIKDMKFVEAVPLLKSLFEIIHYPHALPTHNSSDLRVQLLSTWIIELWNTHSLTSAVAAKHALDMGVEQGIFAQSPALFATLSKLLSRKPEKSDKPLPTPPPKISAEEECQKELECMNAMRVTIDELKNLCRLLSNVPTSSSVWNKVTGICAQFLANEQYPKLRYLLLELKNSKTNPKFYEGMCIRFGEMLLGNLRHRQLFDQLLNDFPEIFTHFLKR